MTARTPTLRERFLELLGATEMRLPMGWVLLVASLLETLMALPPEEQGDLEIVQIKEKLGRLRIVHRGGGPAARALIRRAEDESLLNCDRCGAPGRLRDLGVTLATLCDDHARKEII